MNSDGDFGRCAVISDAVVNLDDDFGLCVVNWTLNVSFFYITSSVRISVISDGDFAR